MLFKTLEKNKDFLKEIEEFKKMYPNADIVPMIENDLSVVSNNMYFYGAIKKVELADCVAGKKRLWKKTDVRALASLNTQNICKEDLALLSDVFNVTSYGLEDAFVIEQAKQLQWNKTILVYLTSPDNAK